MAAAGTKDIGGVMMLSSKFEIDGPGDFPAPKF
jgi:hypothetical protein